MDPNLALNLLTVAGFAITLGSTVWGLTTRTTSEDEAGNKRLTPSGHILIALATASFLVAAASQGVKLLSERNVARDRTAAAMAEQTWRAVQDTRQLQVAQGQRDILEKAKIEEARDRAAAAERRATAAEERILQIQLAAESRTRELAIARDVNMGSRRNLARTESALQQVQRLVEPLKRPDLGALLESPWVGGLEGIDEIRMFLTRVRRTDPPGDLNHVEWNEDGSVYRVSIHPGSPLFPDRAAEPVLWSLVANTALEIAFYANPPSDRTLADTDDVVGQEGRDRPGDAAIKLYSTSKAGFRFYPKTETIELILTAVRSDFYLANTKIVSVPDLRQATVVVAPIEVEHIDDRTRRGSMPIRNGFRLINLSIHVPGADFSLEGKAMRALRTPYGQLYYIAGKLADFERR